MITKQITNVATLSKIFVVSAMFATQIDISHTKSLALSN